MNKLLSANFARLKKNKVFWLCLAFMFLVGVSVAIKNSIDQTFIVSLDKIFFGYAVLILIPLAAFCSLYIGTEYSDGTIRNKLVVGHSRSSIYLSNFIVSSTVGLLLSLSYIVAVSAFGIPLLGFFHTDIKVVLLLLLGSIILILAFSSMFTLTSMLNQNKAYTAVINIVGILALLLLAVYILARLEAPEFNDGIIITDSLGNVMSESTPNPAYLNDTERTVYQCFLDILPTGQALQIANMSAKHLLLMPLYSLLITSVTTVSGVFLFRKKDLK